ncbi:MAG: NAD(P)H-quinone oxidoreductase subunit 3 [Deltaproteobacteria bacterium]|nr:NAD(P)H-quinone oxidoreductase subunit 3 [Deltaproteobacteria bacterium]NIS76124.1 NAD(P)H-quinone oxidoreductase subunit 3 [Deltaproteobacteria bacterium]
MLLHYATVLVFIILAAFTVTVMLLLSRLIHPRKENPVKRQTYECGEVPFGQSWIQFNIRFYVVALIFIIFDVEVALLYPWAVVFKKLGMVAFVEAFIFIVILLVGLAYLWREGDLDWVRLLPADEGSGPSKEKEEEKVAA